MALRGREWRRQIEALSDEFTVVAWEAPGAGRSSDPGDTFRLADWADCLAAFIGALDLGRPHVAGLSFGGGLALELFSAPSPGSPHADPDVRVRWLGRFAPRRGRPTAARVDAPQQRPPGRSVGPGPDPDPLDGGSIEDMVAELKSIMSEFHPAATRVAMRAFAEADLRDVLPRIDVPTLLLYGEKDVRAPRHVWESLHSRIPGSRLVVLPGVGHMIDIEAAERLNAEIRAFLRTIQG